MFYSHEILTRRKYGVATIWLVATLGSKSGLRKVHRKDIMSVNVSKACETVMQPDAPLALRLQSSLLYGISRVYSGQCDYLISDASMAHANIKRMITTTIKATNLDLAGSGKARPEQLVLTDDPAFLPDLNLTQLPDGVDLIVDEDGGLFAFEDSVGLSSLGFDKANSEKSFGRVASGAGSGAVTPQLELMIATSDTMGGDYDFLPGPGPAPDDDDRFLDDVDFEFDADGEMRDLTMPPNNRDSLIDGSIHPKRMKSGSFQFPGRTSRMNSEEAAAQVLREHEEGRDASYSRSLVLGGDDHYAPPDGDLFGLGAQPVPLASEAPSVHKSESWEAEAEGAPTRKKRAPRAIPVIVDTQPEVRTSEMREWRDNYLSNMEAAIKRSKAAKVARKAKHNANTLIFEYGFFGTLRNPVLKSLFSGKALLETIREVNNGAVISAEGKKRKRTTRGSEDKQGRDGNGRRIRARSGEILNSEEEMGLGNQMDEYELPMGEREVPDEDEIEVGREGPVRMSDGIAPSSPSMLPWNIMSDRKSRSRTGSLAGEGLLPSVGGFPSSSRGGSQIGSMDHSARRNSRLSAIRGGMERLSVLASPIGERDEEALGDFDQGFPVLGEEMEFEYFGAGAKVDTQTAQDSQWLAATVEQESTNFFEFLKAEHSRCKQQAEDEDEEPTAFITFEQLLDPAKNGRIVASQAFQHTLLLATKGLVYVSQEESFGSIQISIF